MRTEARNEAVVLMSSSSGRTVGFLVGIGRRDIPFGNRLAEKNTGKGNLLDVLMDGSFLPLDKATSDEINGTEINDRFFNLENSLRRSIRVKDLTSKQLSELEYFMEHINLTEN